MRGKKAILCIGYIIVATICIVSIALLFFSRNKNESEKSKRTIGALYMTMNNPYFEVINEEIKAVVESKGDVLETRDSGMDAKVQAKQVEKFIEEKVDCILINAVDWKKIGSSLEKAKNAPCIFNNWANFYKGEFVSNTILNATSFKKLID